MAIGERYAIMDIHGVTWTPKLPVTPIQNLPRHILKGEVDGLEGRSKDTARLLELTEPLPYSDPIESGETFKDILLASRSFRGKVTGLRGLDKHKTDFFWSYTPAPGAQEVYRELNEAGVRSQCCTGIPTCCADDFRKRMISNRMWQYLDQENPAYLTSIKEFEEKDWVTKTVHPMVAKLALLLYHRLEGHRVVLIEDLRSIAETASAVCGVDVILLKPRPVDSLIESYRDLRGLKQPKPAFLDQYTNPGRIIPVAKVTDVPAALREINFL